MAYRYLEGITYADFAFEATGTTLEEVFASAGDAVIALMSGQPEAIAPVIEKELYLSEGGKDPDAALLHEYLQKIVYYKDAENLFLRPGPLKITRRGGMAELRGTLRGERIDRDRHELGTDVKGVTYHRYELVKTPQGYRAMVVVDT